MIVPYNQHAMFMAQPEDLMGLQYMNPDLIRFEIHRCWVVEAHVAPGSQMSEPFRRFYIDEDSWTGVLGDCYDAQGQFWKYVVSFPAAFPEMPGVILLSYGCHNPQAEEYATTQCF